jgi:hypothetical protein
MDGLDYSRGWSRPLGLHFLQPYGFVGFSLWRVIQRLKPNTTKAAVCAGLKPCSTLPREA